jgi:DNA-binding response OmpR family regulator
MTRLRLELRSAAVPTMLDYVAAPRRGSSRPLPCCSGPVVPRRGAIELQAVSRTAKIAGTRIDLTPLETSLLGALLETPGEPVSRRDLAMAAWGREIHYGNLLDVQVFRLRSKLEGASGRVFIETVRGHGYRLYDRAGGQT